MIQIKKTKVFFGPNIYANTPIILLKINRNGISKTDMLTTCDKINDYFDVITPRQIDQFKPYEYFGTLVLQLTLNIINQNNGLLYHYGIKKTKDKSIELFIEFDTVQVVTKTVEFVLSLFNTVLLKKFIDTTMIDIQLEQISKFVKQLTNYNRNLLTYSKKLDIPSFQFSHDSIYRQYGWGKLSKLFKNGSPIDDSYHGVSISFSKQHTKKQLQSMGMPVAPSMIIHEKTQLKDAIDKIGYPCVIKPTIGSKGNGITANIQNFEELYLAFDKAKSSIYGSSPVMLEKFIKGNDFRLNVVHGKFIIAIERKPSFIIGDGISTIQQLIDRLNTMRNNKQTNPLNLKQINIDETLIQHIQTYDYDLHTVLPQDKTITLNSTANYSTGGIFEIHTKKDIHPQIIQMAETIARTIKIDLLGIDYITTDITQPYSKVKGSITEYNHSLSLEYLNYIDNPLIEAKKIFHGIGRIPIYLIIAKSNDLVKIKNFCKENISSNNIGWMCDNEVYVGKLPLQVYETVGWSMVKMLLRQKTIEKAFIICSLEEIRNKGLPVDKFDTIYISNVQIPKKWQNVLTNNANKIEYFEVIEPILQENAC